MRLIVITLLVIAVYNLQAQTKLSGQIKGATKIDTVEVNLLFDAWYYEQKNIVLSTSDDGSFSTILPVEKAQSIFFWYKKKRLLLYVEPQKDLSVTFQKANLENTVAFEGSLKSENDFRKETGLSFFQLYPKIPNDSLTSPEYILSSIQRSQDAAFTKLNDIKTVVSPAFQKMTQKDITYFPVTKLWEIIWNKDVFSGGKIVSDLPWRAALQTAYQAYPVSHDDAVDSYFYQVMMAYYPRALELSMPGKEAFQNLVEKVFQKPFEEALKEIQTKGRRFWEFKAIHYGFKNRALEFAVASFINNGMSSGELTYINEAFTDFTLRFPKSRYLPYLTTITVPYFKSLSSASSAHMLFDPADSKDTSLVDILAKHKGKIVYIDLWGTWCGPCREEFTYNKELQACFKEKTVDFLYIAFEHRDKPEQLWKETVKYYNLHGRHILAGKQLQENIIKMYSASGAMSFPGYILVDRDGTIKTLYAERPSTKKVLYKQIDGLLN